MEAPSGKSKPGGMTPITSYFSPVRLIVFPSMPGSPPNCLRHRPSLITATWFLPGWSSSGMKDHPLIGFTPSTEKNSEVASTPSSFAGGPLWPVRLNEKVVNAAMLSNTLFCSFQSRKLEAATGTLSPPDLRRAYVSHNMVIRRGSLKGNERKSTALATLNTAVLTPIPRARVMTATIVKPGVRTRLRTAYRIWVHNAVISNSLLLPEWSRKGPNDIAYILPMKLFMRCSVHGTVVCRNVNRSSCHCDEAGAFLRHKIPDQTCYFRTVQLSVNSGHIHQLVQQGALLLVGSQSFCV